MTVEDVKTLLKENNWSVGMIEYKFLSGTLYINGSIHTNYGVKEGDGKFYLVGTEIFGKVDVLMEISDRLDSISLSSLGQKPILLRKKHY